MTARILAVLLAALLCGLLPLGVQPARAGGSLTFGYVTRDGDPWFAEQRLYTGLKLREHRPAVEGAKTALAESRVIGRAAGLTFGLVERQLPAQGDPAALARELAAAGAGIVLLDLPRTPLLALAQAMLAEGGLPINLRLRDDDLRGSACLPGLLHAIPSEAMLSDALAQQLARKGWRRVLVLAGDQPEDARVLGAVEGSLAKFGLTLAAVRPFLLGNDPRQRSERNVALMTADEDYDVVWLVDSIGEFGRYVPYDTFLPRPVVGSEGLVAHAWHWTWERYGAPQLNQRFRKIAGRAMADEDYAAWVAVKALIEAAVRTGSTDPGTLAAYVTSDAVNLDTYKGAIGSFRPWDGQLRQPILLATHDAVIARAPLDGFLHQTNTLDTLGADRPETRCKAAH
ncbi:amino acid/amide ABC transporter substrate-binding protein, HAAT family [Tistlia consotensis]|uniref:Amino acid/amide ABC transporter substrate-binding protein, HAAT family n=1 Tax=Tistlia consotensis USBA 355 TaxID=560819 RepID=A0A1Y6CGQ6_9PROT|nr:hypothetical protein [Tistlia consotensis]SMF54202.1 amino acid/amide ABC transporter substrate-binding protein, HAAT family [Tistlia consotensis USBA 355]SNR86656.1 amino acid/amide ABC transporter substrate-binding protein, HAAT family [Tistlia consotensis]